MNVHDTQIETCVVPIDDFENGLFISLGFQSALPEDIFWHIFSYLEVFELSRVCQVRSTWKHVIYSPYMWNRLDLYGFRYKVNPSLLSQLITNRRFSLLRTLRLDDCRALDISCFRFIASSCRQLKHLSLLRCRQLLLERPDNFASLQDLVVKLDRLEMLELYGCYSVSAVQEIVKRLRAISPHLDLGLLHLQWSSLTGLDRDGNTYPCRLAQESNFHARACWGPISGHIIYSNSHLHVHGNLPSQVLYSCVTHADIEESLIGGNYGQCTVCSRLFAAASMADIMHCRVCHDRKVLRDSHNWTLSDPDSIQGFLNNPDRVINDILDRSNLPKSLKYEKLAEPNLNDCLLDSELKRFKRILVARHANQLRVWADQESIVNGADGQILHDTCLALWTNAFMVLYPIAAMMIILSYFARTLNTIVSEATSTQSTAATLSQSRDESVETQQLLILAICFFATFCIVHICLRRYREQCLSLFRKILVVDFFMIFVFGTTVSLSLIIERLGISFDLISLGLISYNFAALNIVGLYFRGVPPALRRFSMFCLNCMMAIVVLLTLDSALIVILLTVPIFFDLYAQFSRQRNVIVPLLVYRRNEDHPEGLDLELHNPLMHIQHEDDNRHIDPQHDRPVLSAPAEWIPRLSYQSGDIEMRMFDFLWYGLLISIPEATVVGLATATLTGFFTVVVTLMLCPIFQLDIKPLPIAFAMILFMEAIRLYCLDSLLKSLITVALSAPY